MLFRPSSLCSLYERVACFEEFHCHHFHLLLNFFPLPSLFLSFIFRLAITCCFLPLQSQVLANPSWVIGTVERLVCDSINHEISAVPFSPAAWLSVCNTSLNSCARVWRWFEGSAVVCDPARSNYTPQDGLCCTLVSNSGSQQLKRQSRNNMRKNKATSGVLRAAIMSSGEIIKEKNLSAHQWAFGLLQN